MCTLLRHSSSSVRPEASVACFRRGPRAKLPCLPSRLRPKTATSPSGKPQDGPWRSFGSNNCCARNSGSEQNGFELSDSLSSHEIGLTGARVSTGGDGHALRL